MNKRKLFFAIGVIAVILLGSTFFALNQRGKEEKKEKKIGYLTASWEQNYTSMDELVKGSDLIAHVRMLDDGKKVQGKSNTIQYRAKVQNALSSNVVASVMPFSLRAGAYVERILNVDPGCLVVSVARFRVRLAVFSPRPPTIALTYPVC